MQQKWEGEKEDLRGIVRSDSLHEAEGGRHGLDCLAEGNFEGLIASHLGSLSRRALGIDRGTGGLSWGGGSRGGLVLVGLEERHDWQCCFVLKKGRVLMLDG
jgi:hypothetical protein